MGRLFLEFVDDDDGRYTCKACSCDIAGEAALLWEGFMGACTPALLFKTACNVEGHGPQRHETLSTGTYTLEDVRCRACRAPLGWRYLSATDDDQRYKVGACLMQQAALQLHVDSCPASPEELPPASPEELLPASEALRNAALSAGARLRALEADGWD